MKKNKFLIASLLILVGMGVITVGCKKIDKKQSKRAELVVETQPEKDGGDDDEDPIIQGVVKKHNLTVVDSAFVETIRWPNTRVGYQFTNDKGIFQQQVNSGVYFFKVTVQGNSVPYVSDTVRIEQNTGITIFVD